MWASRRTFTCDIKLAMHVVKIDAVSVKGDHESEASTILKVFRILHRNYYKYNNSYRSEIK